MERLAAHVRRRLAGSAQLEQHLALGGAFAHHVAAVVGQIQRVVHVDVQSMRARILAFAPGAQELTVAVEHHHRVLAAVEDVHLVLAVDRDRAHVLEFPAVRQFRPVLDDFVAMLAAT